MSKLLKLVVAIAALSVVVHLVRDPRPVPALRTEPESPVRVVGDTARCGEEPAEVLRSAYITTAIERRCPHFPKYSFRDGPLTDIANRLSERAAHCRSEMALAYEIARGVDPETFCIEALRARDRGIGAIGTRPVAEVKRAAKAAMRTGETLIGAWLDERSPAGLVVIVQSGKKQLFYRTYYTAETSRANGVDEVADELSASRTSKGRRVWETPDVKRLNGEIGGVAIYEYFRNGARIDAQQLVEEDDGSLSAYEFTAGDVPGETKEPWMRGHPVSLD